MAGLATGDPMHETQAVKITKEQYKQALPAGNTLKDRSVELLNMLYDAPNCEATAPQLAAMLGYSDFPPVNALIGKLGKRIARVSILTFQSGRATAQDGGKS